MDLRDAIRQHRAQPLRFCPDPIQPAHIKLLIEGAARSPSHFNSQPWRFALVREAVLRAELDRITGYSSEAPLRLAIGLSKAEYKPGELQGLYSTITLGAVVQTFSLLCAELGLGFDFIEIGSGNAAISERLAIPPDYELMLLFALGYLMNDPERLAAAPVPIDTLISLNTWGQPPDPALRHAPSLLWTESDPR